MILDQDSRDMFTLFRDTVKSDMVRDYIKQIGFQSSFDIPYPKDIDIKSAKDLYLYISNQKLSFENFKKYVIDQARKHLEEGGDDSGYGGYGEQTTDTGDMGTGTGEEQGGTPSEADMFGDMGGTETPPGEEGGEPQEPQEEPAEGEGGQTPGNIDFDNTPPPPSF